METEQKIGLIPHKAYKLSNEELGRFYIVLAFFRYQRERFLDYDEKLFPRRLKKNLKIYLVGTQSLMWKDTNNHFQHKFEFFQNTPYNYRISLTGYPQ